MNFFLAWSPRNVPPPGRVRAQIAQRTVGVQDVEQLTRLEEVDDERKLAKAGQAASSPLGRPIRPGSDQRNCQDRPLPAAPDHPLWLLKRLNQPVSKQR
jgi:hypothetical protein